MRLYVVAIAFLVVSFNCYSEFTHYSFDRSKGAEACPYGIREGTEQQMSSRNGSYEAQVARIKALGAIQIGVRTAHYSGVDNKGNPWNSSTDDAIYVAEVNCANVPGDDTGDDGCYPDEVSEGGYCGPTDDCSSYSSARTFKLAQGKSCSDYCEGSSPFHGRGTVKLCSGEDGEKPLGPDRGDCPMGWYRPPLKSSCEPMPDPICTPPAVFNSITKSCQTPLDPGDGGGDPDPGDGGGNPDPGDGDGDNGDIPNLPENCRDAFNKEKLTCNVNEGYKITLLNPETCTFRCNPPGTGGGDPDPGDGGGNPDPGDGGDPDPGDGGEPDTDPDPGTGGGGGDDDGFEGNFPGKLKTESRTFQGVNQKFWDRMSGTELVSGFSGFSQMFRSPTQAECPAFVLDVPSPINVTVSTAIHCQIFAQHAHVFSAIFMIMWVWIAGVAFFRS